MLKSCGNKEFCGSNGQLEGEVKEAMPQIVSLRIILLTLKILEETLNPVIKNLWEPCISQ